MSQNESYLGDGLYVSFDGWQFELRAPRPTGNHYVALEPIVLERFIEYVKETRIKQASHQPPPAHRKETE